MWKIGVAQIVVLFCSLLSVTQFRAGQIALGIAVRRWTLSCIGVTCIPKHHYIKEQSMYKDNLHAVCNQVSCLAISAGDTISRGLACLGATVSI